MKKYIGLALSLMLCSILLISGCQQGFKVGETKTIEVAPPITGISAVEFGMFPATYFVGNFINGATAELVFTVFSNLDFASPGYITIVNANQMQADNNGATAWQNCTKYCIPIDSGVDVPAHGSRQASVQVLIPEGIDVPHKWVFYVSYQSEGYRWGNYVTTASKNFVFTPAGFQGTIGDFSQTLFYETWGNNPDIMVRMQYDTPPMSIAEGTLIYSGSGEQVLKPWLDPNLGQTLMRQYTDYSINLHEILPQTGGSKLFIRAWQKHTVFGVWDGTWDALGQSLIVPEVLAKVVVTMG